MTSYLPVPKDITEQEKKKYLPCSQLASQGNNTDLWELSPEALSDEAYKDRYGFVISPDYDVSQKITIWTKQLTVKKIIPVEFHSYHKVNFIDHPFDLVFSWTFAYCLQNEEGRKYWFLEFQIDELQNDL